MRVRRAPGKRSSRAERSPRSRGNNRGLRVDGRLRKPHIENVRPVRPPGQAQLRHSEKLPRKALHDFTTSGMVRHPASRPARIRESPPVPAAPHIPRVAGVPADRHGGARDPRRSARAPPRPSRPRTPVAPRRPVAARAPRTPPGAAPSRAAGPGAAARRGGRRLQPSIRTTGAAGSGRGAPKARARQSYGV